MLPLDSLRPFKSRLEQFVPRENIPWARLAANLIALGLPQFKQGCLTSETEIARLAAWVVETLALPPETSILELGCGPGQLSHRLARCGYRVTGLDIAQPFIAYAQARAAAEQLSCTFVNGSAAELESMGPFGAVLIINAMTKQSTMTELHHLLRQIKFALQPRGHLLAEFSVAPTNLAQCAAVTECGAFHPQSPWSNQFHFWLMRELIFAAAREKVVHHILLEPDGKPQEFWLRYASHSLLELEYAFDQHGFQIRQILGSSIGDVYHEDNSTCLIWATSRE